MRTVPSLTGNISVHFVALLLWKDPGFEDSHLYVSYYEGREEIKCTFRLFRSNLLWTNESFHDNIPCTTRQAIRLYLVFATKDLDKQTKWQTLKRCSSQPPIQLRGGSSLASAINQFEYLRPEVVDQLSKGRGGRMTSTHRQTGSHQI